ncbi:MAG: agmatinase [Proteobacteria bacterium]|nr:MAG: agmatinase [Pseudomonadota bacterium]PIE18446.1 MAG: agmatinase [Pseudomonadota bacterium]
MLPPMLPLTRASSLALRQMAIEQLHDTFLGLPPDECTYDESRVVLLRAPYDGTTSYMAGARDGPAAILAASAQVEPYDRELGCEPCEVGIHALPALVPPAAAGPKAVIDQIEALSLPVVADGKLPFVLGGEHSVTLGAARAVAEVHPRLSFLQIDAHLDLRPSYEGSPYSHACVAYHLLGLRGDGGQVVQVGVRTACPEELAVIEEHGLAPIWGEDVWREEDDAWIARAVEGLADHPVYVTVDVDGLDPSVIPGTGTPVPGGLGWYQTLRLLRAVGQACRVVGCDVVELAPGPGDHRSAYAAAQLVYKMIGYFEAARPGREARCRAPKPLKAAAS